MQNWYVRVVFIQGFENIKRFWLINKVLPLNWELMSWLSEAINLRGVLFWGVI